MELAPKSSIIRPMEHIYKEAVSSHVSVIQLLAHDAALALAVSAIGRTAAQTLKNGGKILICGNGGSAADSQHIAAELVGRFGKDRPPLAAIALTVDSSAITAIGNDYDFSAIYARQVEGLGKPGDLLIGITTSGNSPNVVQAVMKAESMGLKTAGLTGANIESKIAAVADVCAHVPSSDTPRIQEAHILIGHIICAQIEKELFGI